MTLGTVLNLMAFNVEYQRFFDNFGDFITPEDAEEMESELIENWTPSGLKTLTEGLTPENKVNTLDLVGQEMESEALHEFGALGGVTREVFKILVSAKYSHNRGWFDDWETLEGDLINYLPNNDLKNWGAIFRDYTPARTDWGNFEALLKIISNRFLNLVWGDIQGVSVPVVEKYRILEEYRENYDPSLDPIECYGSQFFIFENLLNCETYGELLQEIAERENYLNLVEYSEDGVEIHGETAPEDYLHLLNKWLGVACVWRGY